MSACFPDRKMQNAFGHKLRTSPLEVKLQWVALKAKTADPDERQDVVDKILAVGKGDFSGLLKRKEKAESEKEMSNDGAWVSYEIAKMKEGRTIHFKPDPRVQGLSDIVFLDLRLNKQSCVELC